MKPYSDIAELIETLKLEIESRTEQITTLNKAPESFMNKSFLNILIRLVRVKQKILLDH